MVTVEAFKRIKHDYRSFQILNNIAQHDEIYLEDYFIEKSLQFKL